LRKLRVLLGTYREAGGKQGVVMFHDAEHGLALIEALARHGNGLPANVLPVEVNEITQVGLEAVAAAHAYGASAVRLLTRAKARHDIAGLKKTIELAQPILTELGFAGARVEAIETDDPDGLDEALRGIGSLDPTLKPATFVPTGNKREVMRLALRELHAAAPSPIDIVPLPEGAPFGTIEVRVEGCTLCPFLRVGVPDRRACPMIPSGQCCDLPRMRASNADCASNLSGKGDKPQTANRFPCCHSTGPRH
jgi:hypothetical protein